jgi:hypothetical protein
MMTKKNHPRGKFLSLAVIATTAILAAACAPKTPGETADILLVNGRVYTLSWGEPDLEGKSSPDASRDASGWRPDAEAGAVRGDPICR